MHSNRCKETIEYERAWRKSRNFTVRHPAAWIRLKYGRSCPFHDPANINIQYSYKLEAEQMGLEWKPEHHCEDFNIIRQQVKLSTFKEVEKRRVEKILAIKKQMLIEQAEYREKMRKKEESFTYRPKPKPTKAERRRLQREKAKAKMAERYNPSKFSFKEPTENAKVRSAFIADAFDIKQPNDDDVKKEMTLDFSMKATLEEVIGRKECERMRACMKKIEEKSLDATSDDISRANVELLLGKETNFEDEQENNEVVRFSTILDNVFKPVSDDCEKNDNMLFDEADDY